MFANHNYDNIARFYDWAAGWTLAPVRRTIASLAAENGAKRVIDFGCGTGLQLVEFGKFGLDAVGIDNSGAMLDIARKRLGEGSHDKLVMSSAIQVPFADNSFDLGVIALVLHESEEEPAKILNEAFRLAPKVFVLDWGLVERNLDYPVHLCVRFIERLAGKRHYASYKNYMRNGALEALLERYSRNYGANVVWRKHLLFNAVLLMQIERAE